jgi:NAD-dependent dihydropyrimidine dehydrogenase PreA subunit
MMTENMKRKFRPDLSLPSTRAFVREAHHTSDCSFFDLVHGYVYARWPYHYISIGTGEHPLARTLGRVVNWLVQAFSFRLADDADQVTFADTYHGKVIPLEAATQLVTVEEDVRLIDLEKIVPYARARDIVLKNPDHIVALECPCRAARPDPCLPLDVCLVIGEPFASFVIEHHPRRSRWITQEEAVEILCAERDRGHVSHAFFKDAMLNRFYAICNCCACCCGAMQAHQRGTPMLTSSGYVVTIDADLCIGCGICVNCCQFGALLVEDSAVTLDSVACMGCGVCVSKCEQGALSLVHDPSKGEPLEIRKLIARESAL